MKTEHILLLAGAIGIGYLIAKKKAAETTQAQTQASVIPPQVRVAQIPSEDEEYFDYVPVGWGWGGPGWFGGGRRGGGGHGGHHHGGGHHGGHH